MPRAFSIPIAPGCEPEPLDIDDLTVVYQDDPECAVGPSGHCEFSMADQFKRCIYCGKENEQ